MIVGFSASAGNKTEFHSIVSWDFESKFTDGEIEQAQSPNSSEQENSDTNILWVVGVAVSVMLLVTGLGCLLLFLRRKKLEGDVSRLGLDSAMEDILVMEDHLLGFPKKFTYRELVEATKNFSEDGKLGQGGFGVVYMGFLNGEKVAVKRLLAESVQGKKEFVSEVTAISRLRHRSLVKLIGWSHENGEFLIVYEYMPNGSLDAYLFGKRGSLDWPTRFNIARGLAGALLYLQEECEQCVLHRDVKSSNVMLDSGLNAMLGDFGLARVVDHELGGQMTRQAGTIGYTAPECMMTGRASKESDVFSFGVVSLDIACGRKAVDRRARREEEVVLVEWVWGMNGEGGIMETADARLRGDFDEGEMERLLVVGLWCVHPDCKARPTMREAIQALAFLLPAPILSLMMPRPMYNVPSRPLNQNDNGVEIVAEASSSGQRTFFTYAASPEDSLLFGR